MKDKFKSDKNINVNTKSSAVLSEIQFQQNFSSENSNKHSSPDPYSKGEKSSPDLKKYNSRHKKYDTPGFRHNIFKNSMPISDPQSQQSLYQYSPRNNTSTKKKQQQKAISQSRSKSKTENQSKEPLSDADSSQISMSEQQIDINLKIHFLRKYMFIFTLHLILIFTMVWSMYDSPYIEDFNKDNAYVAWFFFVSWFMLLPSLCFIKQQSTWPPWNYIIYVYFSASIGYWWASLAGAGTPDVIGIWTAAIMIPSFSINLYTAFTRQNYSFLTSFIISVLQSASAIVPLSIWADIPAVHIVFASIITVILGAYLVINSAWIIGKTCVEYSINDHIFVAIRIYINYLIIIRYFCLVCCADKELTESNYESDVEQTYTEQSGTNNQQSISDTYN